jgi:predicted phosphodiesterase
MSERALPLVASRVGLIGDVHTERARLAAALEFFASAGVDRVLCTGDVPDGPGDCRDVDACCELLAKASVLTISGNHDRWLLDGEMRDLPDATPTDEVSAATVAFLRALPQTVTIDTPAGLALLCHGLGGDDMAQVSPFDRGRELEDNAALQDLLEGGRYRYVLNGHTHKAMVRAIAELTIVNAGTLLADHGAGCVLLDFARREAVFHTISAEGRVADGERKAL